MSGQTYELSLPDVPPSLNAVGSRGKSHWAFSNAKKKWEGMCFIALLEMKVPKGLERIEASAMLRFKSKRKRDEGNFRVLLEKALGDILVTGGWLEDDTPECYSFGTVEFDPERGDPLTLIRLEVQYP